MSDIHDLLDSVSTGQPAHRLSVNDLVRAGRRRQRNVAAGVAGGTAAVVAVAAAAIVPGIGGSPSSSPAAASPTISPAVTAQLPPAPTASTQPIYAGPAGATAPIVTAHLLIGGRTLQTTFITDSCSAAGLSATETATTVTLTLTTVAPVPSQRAGATYPNCVAKGQTSAYFVPVGQTLSIGSGDLRTTLAAPLGNRRLIDATTGRTIPYTSETQVETPSWLPTGWERVGDARPELAQSWATTFQTDGGPNPRMLMLTQTENAKDALGGAANAVVGTAPARVSGDPSTLQVRWWDGDRLFDLAYLASSPTTCNAGKNGKPHDVCTVTGPAPTIARADLLQIAASVRLP